MEHSGNSVSPSIHRYNTRSKKRPYSINYNEDSDISDSDLSDNNSVEDNNEFNIHTYRQYLSELFPSQYMNAKVSNQTPIYKMINRKKLRTNNALSDNQIFNIIIAKSNSSRRRNKLIPKIKKLIIQ